MGDEAWEFVARKMQAEVERLRAFAAGLDDENTRFILEVERLQVEVAALRTALESADLMCARAGACGAVIRAALAVGVPPEAKTDAWPVVTADGVSYGFTDAVGVPPEETT
jgi:hypothetical protein